MLISMLENTGKISTLLEHALDNPIISKAIESSKLNNINHCRLYNAKSIFIHRNSPISNNSVLHKYAVSSI